VDLKSPALRTEDTDAWTVLIRRTARIIGDAIVLLFNRNAIGLT
jgi:hypothetical protein